MDHSAAPKTDSTSAKPLSKHSNSKTNATNAYQHIHTNLDVYTNLSPSTALPRLQAPARALQALPSTFRNPYVPGVLINPRPAGLSRSTSDAPVLAAPYNSPFVRMTTVPAVYRPVSLSTALGPTAVKSASQPLPEPKASSVTRHQPKMKPKASKQTAPTPVTHAPGPDSIMIPRHLAVKMNYDDFRSGEFLTRDEWPENMRYPANLDPPNGLTSLRCLFCEKQYAGPNARSMWRRHVSGKHNFTLNGGKSVVRLVKPHGSGAANENAVRKRDHRVRKRAASSGTVSDPKATGSNLPDPDSAFRHTSADVSHGSEHGEGEEGQSGYASWEDDMDGMRDISPALPNVDGNNLDPYGRDLYSPLKDVPQNIPNSIPMVHAPTLRRVTSTPAYLPSTASTSTLDPADHPFLLPPFSEASDRPEQAHAEVEITLPTLPETDNTALSADAWPTGPVLAFPSSSDTGDAETVREGVDVVDEVTLRGLKVSASLRGNDLLPSITLAPPLRSPRRGKVFSTPAPSRSFASTSNRWLQSRLDDSPGLVTRPSTPGTPRHQHASSYPSFPSRPIIGDSASTPAPIHKRTLSESDRRRWMLALESPGPVSSLSSSPIQPLQTTQSRLSQSLSSPQAPAESSRQGRSTRKVAPFFLLPPSIPRPSSAPFSGGRPLDRTPAKDVDLKLGGSVQKGYNRGRTRARTISSGFDSSPITPSSSAPASRTSFSTGRTPSHAHSHTRSSSLDDRHEEHDDPFHSESFPFDLNLRLNLDRSSRHSHAQRGSNALALLYTESPMLKRTRDEDDLNSALVLEEGTLPSPHLDMSDFNWDGAGDSSPVRKRARPSASS